MKKNTAALLVAAVTLAAHSTDGYAFSLSGIKDKVVSTFKGKPSTPTAPSAPSTSKPLSTHQTPVGPLACDKGRDTRIDGKPCVPTCDMNRENPFDGSENCIPPSKMSQIGTQVKTGIQTVRDGIQYNQDTINYNLDNTIELNKEGTKVDRGFRVDSDGSNSANSLGIG